MAMKMKYTFLLLLLEILTPFAISQEYHEKPIFRYLLAPSPDSCKWCNMRPQRVVRDSVLLPRVVDLFDLPIFANLIQNRQDNREIIKNIIKLL
uniref:Seminal fluid protein HACP039 n=1 Tax=Heliconius melpomene TaxID=34740 RepID=D9HQ89_HELME|nr:seminal fluid protein HACP039 [Heliconius melpomene]